MRCESPQRMHIVTLRRETEDSAADTLPLFSSLESSPPAAASKTVKTAHKPVTDFTLYADQSRAADLSRIVDQWRNDIGEAVPLAIAKESLAAYAEEPPAKHAKQREMKPL
jgi:hypothetical protein